MTTLRFFATGGSLFENIARRVIERDPQEMRSRMEEWGRQAIYFEQRGDIARAKIYAHDSLEVQLALSALELQRKASGPYSWRRA